MAFSGDARRLPVSDTPCRTGQVTQDFHVNSARLQSRLVMQRHLECSQRIFRQNGRIWCGNKVLSNCFAPDGDVTCAVTGHDVLHVTECFAQRSEPAVYILHANTYHLQIHKEGENIFMKPHCTEVLTTSLSI